MHELDEELLRVLGGDASFGEQLKQFYKAFETTWNHRYTGAYQ